MEKKTVVFDFDGVIHSYKSGWKGSEEIPDPPVYGIRDVIKEVRKEFKVVVVSTRCSTMLGTNAIKAYLRKWGIEVDDVLKEKPPAIAYIDDRAINFDGNTNGLVEKISSFKNWIEKDRETDLKLDDDYDHLNIIFLDVDGVLNSMGYFNSRDEKDRNNDVSEYHVILLSTIYKLTNARIILSSTWRELDDPASEGCYSQYKILEQALAKYGMKIHGKTKYIENNRPLEIKTWLKENIRDMTKVNFISLDDDFSYDQYTKHGIEFCLIKTDFYSNDMFKGGLQPAHVQMALSKLRRR